MTSRSERADSRRLSAVPVLMYHSISARASRRFKEFTAEPGMFAEHMSALADSGYQPILLSILTAGIASRRQAILADTRSELHCRLDEVLSNPDAFAAPPLTYDADRAEAVERFATLVADCRPRRRGRVVAQAYGRLSSDGSERLTTLSG